MRLGYTNYRLRELDQLLHRLTTRCVAASYVKYSRAHTFNVYRRSLRIAVVNVARAATATAKNIRQPRAPVAIDYATT